MQVNQTVRENMLETLKDKVNDSFVLVGGILTGYIEFFDSTGVAVCELAFKDMDIVSTSTDNAILRFKSIDDSYTLKSTVHTVATGGVAEFKIKGIDASTYIITGTAGSLASSSDLNFNLVNWQVGTYVTIENFEIVMPNGS